jgi:DNA-binding protein HU-beta
MNKAELIAKVAESTGLSKAAAGRALKEYLDAIGEALACGDKVTLVGFGTFSVSQRAARTGINPQTGNAIKIPAKKVAKFKPGAALATSVNSKKKCKKCAPKKKTAAKKKKK